MKKISIIFLLLFTLFSFQYVKAQDFTDLANKLAGKILLQVEENGEAWYVEPVTRKRFFLGRPDDAFQLMRNLGNGITNKDLEKIQIGLIKYADGDIDNDGLGDMFEDAIGTDKNNKDSDGDGFSDYDEISQGYNPMNTEIINIDQLFSKNHSGQIFLQTEKNGEAWYINPNDKKRYYLGRPDDAFQIMRNLGLGITNENLNNIIVGNLQIIPDTKEDISTSTAEAVIENAANAIRNGNINDILQYYNPEIHNAVKNAMKALDKEGKFYYGNILGSTKLKKDNNDIKIFSTTVYYMSWQKNHEIKLIKQTDGSWLIDNL